MLTLKEAIEKVSWPDVRRRLAELYPDQQINLKAYERVFAELQMLDPAANPDRNRVCVAKIPANPGSGAGDSYDVYIYNARKKTDYAPAFHSWPEWLGFFVGEGVPLVDAVCHALYEMTYDGFDQKAVQEKQDRMKKAFESAIKDLLGEGGQRA